MLSTSKQAHIPLKKWRSLKWKLAQLISAAWWAA